LQPIRTAEPVVRFSSKQKMSVM